MARLNCMSVEFEAVLKPFTLDFEKGLRSTVNFIKLPPV